MSLLEARSEALAPGGGGCEKMKNSHSINLVHMGDSITFGQYVDRAVRWTSLVELRLSKLLAGRGVELKVFNCGVSGETTRQDSSAFQLRFRRKVRTC